MLYVITVCYIGLPLGLFPCCLLKEMYAQYAISLWYAYTYLTAGIG